jgi:hypothetical protein
MITKTLVIIDMAEITITDAKYIAILGTLRELSGMMPIKNCENIIIESRVMISCCCC